MGIWSAVLVGVVLTTSAAPAHGVDAAAWQTARADPPNVVGLSYADAVSTLRAWQPLVEIVVLPGVPASADPTLLTVDNEAGDETSVYVSLVTAMPGVVGMTIDEAAPTLTAHGIWTVLDPADSSGDSVIDSQTPDAGTTVRIDANSGRGTSDGGGGSPSGGGTGLDGVPAAVVTLHIVMAIPTRPPDSPNTTVDTGGGPGPAVTDDDGGASAASGSAADGPSPWTPAAVFGGGGLCVLVVIVLIIVVMLSARRRRQPQLAPAVFPPPATRFPRAEPAQQPRPVPRLTTRVQWPPSTLAVRETGAASGRTLTVRLHIDPSQPTIEEVSS